MRIPWASIRRGAALLAVACVMPAAALAAGDEGGGDKMGWRIFNLALLLFVLGYFFRKPMQTFFRHRRDEIQGDLQSAARLHAEAEERYAKWQGQLAELDSELEQIRERARKRAESERESILADARAAAERIRSDARVAVEQELRRARVELRQEAADLSVQLAADLLQGQVTDDDRSRLVDEFITTIEAPSSESGR